MPTRLGKKEADIDPLQRARELAQQSVASSDTDEAGERPQPEVNVLLQRLKVVPIGRLRPGRYQKREKIDQEKYRQLVGQMKSEGLRYIFFVSVDQEDDSFYNPTMGGHIRLMAAKEVGIQEVLIFQEDYDQLRMAKGSVFENQGRQDLDIVAKGKTFQLFREDFGWTQERIAKELLIEGGRDHVARCMLAAESAPDIQAMLMQDPDRGFRVLTYLRQLDVLDEGKGNQGRAARARAPIIAAFLNREISTDGVKVAVDQVLRPSAEQPTFEGQSTFQVEVIRRTERITATRKSWQRFLKEVGDAVPTQGERDELLALRREIDAVLARQVG
jgi:ParB/RepB/Spo0J family partition protein